MRVARLHGAGDIRVGDEPDPVAGPGETLVEVAAVGLCGSDLHWYGEGGIGDAALSRPLVIGHEFAGVARGGPLDGQLVAVDPAIPCGRCELCLAGYRNLCPTVRFAGHGETDGGLRERLAWPTDLLHPVPSGLSAVDAALLEPLGVALHAHDLADLRYGASVAVIGCGPIGLLLVQLLRPSAGLLLAADPLPHRLAAAIHSGASPLGSVDAGLGVDVVFEVAGTEAAVAASIEAVRPGGRVVLAGIPDDDRTTFSAGPARRKGLTIALVRRMNEAYPRALRTAARGAVDLAAVVTDHFGLDSAPEALAEAAGRAGLKTVIEMAEAV
jgi:L-iditol 2-dehydrogenase